MKRLTTASWCGPQRHPLEPSPVKAPACCCDRPNQAEWNAYERNPHEVAGKRPRHRRRIWGIGRGCAELVRARRVINGGTVKTKTLTNRPTSDVAT